MRAELARRPRPSRRGPRATETRTCEWCAESYVVPAGKRDNQRFCSNACHLLGRHLRGQSLSENPDLRGRSCPVFWMPCAWCDVVFQAGRRRKRPHVCEECAAGPRVWFGSCRKCAAPLRTVGTGARWYCDGCRDEAVAETARELRRDAKHRRRARKAGGERVYRAKVAERDGFRCHICGEKVLMGNAVPHPKAPTLDHLVPLAAGGTHEPGNVRLAHFLCNSRRGARGPAQLLLVA